MKHVAIGGWVIAFVLAAAGAVTHAQVTVPADAPNPPLSTQNPPFKRIATVQQLMIAVIEPTSNTVFRVEVEAPQDLRGWNTITNAALALAEAGNLLMLPGRARDSGDWIKRVQELMDLSVKAMKAAEAQNAEQVVAVGYEINDVCRNCHVQYKPRRQPRVPN
jgi:hypothetical protein